MPMTWGRCMRRSIIWSSCWVAESPWNRHLSRLRIYHASILAPYCRPTRQSLNLWRRSTTLVTCQNALSRYVLTNTIHTTYHTTVGIRVLMAQISYLAAAMSYQQTREATLGHLRSDVCLRQFRHATSAVPAKRFSMHSKILPNTLKPKAPLVQRQMGTGCAASAKILSPREGPSSVM